MTIAASFVLLMMELAYHRKEKKMLNAEAKTKIKTKKTDMERQIDK